MVNVKKIKIVLPSLLPLLATVQATILDFGVMVDFGVSSRKLILWLL